MRRVTVALTGGLTLLAVAVGVTLVQSPMVVARNNGTPLTEDRIATTRQPVTYCQTHEMLPAGTSAIRLALAANTGPRVTATVSTGKLVVATGTQGPGWTGRVVTVPLRPLAHAVPEATVCASVRTRHESILLFGKAAPPAIAAHVGRKALSGRMSIEYLRPGSRSWASMIPSTARRLGLGRAFPGTWNALLVLELVATMTVTASVLVVKELR